MRARLRWGALYMLVAVAACGKHQDGSGPPPSNAPLLGEEEILATKAANMYDAVRVRRPLWLQRSGARPTSLTGTAPEVVVYLDGQWFGDGPQALGRLLTSSVRYAEYLSPSEAQARFGVGHLAGVINVRSRGTRN